MSLRSKLQNRHMTERRRRRLTGSRHHVESLERRYCMVAPTAVIVTDQLFPDADLVIEFDQAMDVATVTDLSAYRVFGPSGLVHVESVGYDTTTNRAALDLQGDIPLELGAYQFQLLADRIENAGGESYRPDPDFAPSLTNSSSAKLPIRRGTGAGDFQTSEILDAPRNLEHIASGDVNGDGRPDLITTQMGRDGIYVFRSLPDGGYGVPSEYMVGNSITDVAVGDLNGDGFGDIVVTSLANQFTVMLSDGNGGYAISNVTTPDRAKSVATGDFDEDTTIDLAVSVENTGVIFYFNPAGDGNFSNPVNRVTVTANTPSAIVAADVDQDGFLDIAAAGPVSRSTTVLYGRTGQAFDTFEYGTPGFSSSEVAVGDVTGDGINDLVMASSASQQVVLLTGLATPRQYVSNQAFNLGNTPTGLAVADLNHDGFDDVLVSTDNYGSRDPISRFLGQADGLGAREFAGAGTFGAANGIVVDEFDPLTNVGLFYVVDPNNPPVANNDEFVVERDRADVLLDVLSNDSSAPDLGERLTIIAVTNPDQGGSVTIAADGGSLRYTPRKGFLGTERFSYTIADGNGGQDQAQVTIRVNTETDDLVRFTVRTVDANGIPINRVPLGEEFFVELRGEDVGSNPKGLFAAFFDVFYTSDVIAAESPVTFGPAFPYGQSYDLSREGLIDEMGGFGGFAATGGGARIVATIPFRARSVGVGTLTVDPADGTPGHDVLVYQRNLAIPVEQIDFGTRTIEVTAAVDAVDDQFGVLEDSVANSLPILKNDSVSAGGSLVVVHVGTPNHGGTASIAADGLSVIYTPRPDFVGIEWFTYQVDDGHGATDEATIVIDVDNVNDPPKAIDDYVPDIAEDSRNNRINVLGNDDIAPDLGETLTIIAVGSGSKGGTARITTDGQAVLYSPAPNYFGPESFTYAISDGRGGEAQATVSVEVVNVNDDPAANDDHYALDKGAPATELAVLVNDSSAPDIGETLVIDSVGATSQGGVALVSADQKRILYTPQAGFTGVETFAYAISDGHGGMASAAVTVTVSSAWQNPRNPLDVNDDNFVTPIDALLIINDLQIRGPRLLPVPATQIDGQWMYLDVNGDAFTSPIDALIVINYLNGQLGGEGEFASNDGESDEPASRDYLLPVSRLLRKVPEFDDACVTAATRDETVRNVDAIFASTNEFSWEFEEVFDSV